MPAIVRAGCMLGSMRALYSLLLVIARPLVLLRLRWRARKAPDYGDRVAERFGAVPPGIPTGVFWIHTVSAGETIAAAPLIRKLTGALAEQDVAVLVTTMTPTGSAEVRRLFGDTVAHCYAPYDFASGVRQFLDAVQPRALVLMETEIWPNMIHLTAQRNIPVALVNARLSERSARGYARVKGLISPILRHLSWIACQYPADARRFRELGASGAQVEVVGTVKFDVAQSRHSTQQQVTLELLSRRAGLDDRRTWIAGSTHAGEEAVLIAAHEALLARVPDACLLLVPRHPERFAEVFELARRRFAAARLSQWVQEGGALVADAMAADATAAQHPQQPAVVVVDVMGLLGALYPLADVAFIGGSLGKLGGHNPIEAAVAKVPILMGPGRFNFASVCAAFADADCLHLTASEREITEQLARLLTDADDRIAEGLRAAAVVAEHVGATQRLFERLRVLSD